MASMKAKKGNPFEREVAYNFQKCGFKVTRIDDNTSGVDLIADREGETYAVECKHHKGFTWNKLLKILGKTNETCSQKLFRAYPLLVFKGNNQPPLIIYDDWDHGVPIVKEAKYFISNDISFRWERVPKGYKVWRN